MKNLNERLEVFWAVQGKNKPAKAIDGINVAFFAATKDIIIKMSDVMKIMCYKYGTYKFMSIDNFTRDNFTANAEYAEHVHKTRTYAKDPLSTYFTFPLFVEWMYKLEEKMGKPNARGLYFDVEAFRKDAASMMMLILADITKPTEATGVFTHNASEIAREAVPYVIERNFGSSALGDFLLHGKTSGRPTNNTTTPLHKEELGGEAEIKADKKSVTIEEDEFSVTPKAAKAEIPVFEEIKEVIKEVEKADTVVKAAIPKVEEVAEPVVEVAKAESAVETPKAEPIVEEKFKITVKKGTLKGAKYINIITNKNISSVVPGVSTLDNGLFLLSNPNVDNGSTLDIMMNMPNSTQASISMPILGWEDDTKVWLNVIKDKMKELEALALENTDYEVEYSIEL